MTARGGTPRLRGGLPGFMMVWAGQLVSLVGSAMTRFAITIWAYEETGSATVLALVAFFSFGPSVALSPLAGAIVDRWNRKAIIMSSDLAAGVATIALLILHANGQLEIWHLYAAGALAGSFDAFQFPAFSAAVTTMVEKRHYARASGLMSTAGSISAIAAPALAGIVLAFGGLSAVLILDVVTFVFAVVVLALVHIPPPIETEEGRASRGTLGQDMALGFRYIWRRKGLLGMQLIFFQSNLFLSATMVLLAPMVLARTGNDEIVLGTVQSMLGVGGLLGGLLVAAWGGPRRKVHGVFVGMAVGNFIGQALMGIGRGPLVWSLGAFCLMFAIPIVNGSNQSIWQSKVPPDLQGRVFSARRLIAQITGPAAMLIAGPLADYVFEPAMAPGGSLAGTFGGLVGVGPGAGIGLLFVATGSLTALGGLSGYLFPAVRNIETRLPDHAQADTSIDPVEAPRADRPPGTPLDPDETELPGERSRDPMEPAQPALVGTTIVPDATPGAVPADIDVDMVDVGDPVEASRRLAAPMERMRRGQSDRNRWLAAMVAVGALVVWWLGRRRRS